MILTERQIRILARHYLEGETLTQIAHEYGETLEIIWAEKEAACQILARRFLLVQEAAS